MTEYTFTKEQLENEVWKPIPNYEGFYEVSNIGRVRKTQALKILKPTLSNHYLRIGLFLNKKAKQFYIHKLVALTFIGERPPDRVINHIDGQKLNNAPENLEYVTIQENVRHAVKLGLTCKGAQKPNATVKEEDVNLIRILQRFGSKQTSLAELFGLNKYVVGDIVRGKRWKHIEPVPLPELKQIGELEFEFQYLGKTHVIKGRYKSRSKFRRRATQSLLNENFIVPTKS